MAIDVTAVPLEPSLYSMSVNRPSGGTNESILSFVHFGNLYTLRTRRLYAYTNSYRTHGWNEQSIRICGFEKFRKMSGVPRDIEVPG